MFISLPRAGSSVPPLEIEDDPGGSKTIVTPIANCTQTDRITSVDCRLSPTSFEGVSYWEFSFEITVASLDGSEAPFSTQDRNIAYGYIPRGIRHRVMEIVCGALEALIRHVRPVRIYRVTKTINPPEKALRKHNLLTDVLQALGYRVTRCDKDRWGRIFWVCELGE
jgi:hypothetical protein